MEAFQENETWIAVSLPEGEFVIRSKWVFVIRKSPHGNSSQCKAFIAEGFPQPLLRNVNTRSSIRMNEDTSLNSSNGRSGNLKVRGDSISCQWTSRRDISEFTSRLRREDWHRIQITVKFIRTEAVTVVLQLKVCSLFASIHFQEHN